MGNIFLTTAVDKIETIDFEDIFIPKGVTGMLLDAIIENGKAKFLLDFEEYGIEWYEVNELEENF